MKNLILASGSPRRKELLEKLQTPFKTITSHTDETISSEWSPQEAVVHLAERKAGAVYQMHSHSMIIGADTVVSLNGQILGKPTDREHASTMLKQLSGKTHEVYTGVALMFNDQTHTFFEKTEVTFWDLDDQEVERYLDTNEPYDKAGAYGIQGLGALFVKEITGDYYSVVGLPISKLARLIRTFGESR